MSMHTPDIREPFERGLPRAAADHGAGESPRLLFFGVTSRRDLAQRAAAAAPGARFSPRRSWTDDPGPPRRLLRGGRDARVGLWFWSGTPESLQAQATAVLLRLVHPLVAGGLPYCMGFPFGPEAFAPRSLAFGDATSLDLEDIGRLLGVGCAETARRGSPAPPEAGSPGSGVAPGSRSGFTSGPVPGSRSTSRSQAPIATDGVRLDAAQNAAVAHALGPARVLAPAGSGKTKTLVSRVAELVGRGVDPSGILMLAFNRKAAEQLEERLAALGIATTRRIGAPPEPGRRRGGGATGRRSAGDRRAAAGRPQGVHCATFNAFGHRYQREVLRARVTLDLDGAGLRLLMKRAMEAAGVSLAELKPARGSDPVGAFMGGLPRVRSALEPPDQVEIDVESTGDPAVVSVAFAATHARYAALQAAAGLQSFDDQIYLTVADLLADPAHRAFLEQRFDHVLVDEFQDLNGAQLALVDVLSRPSRDLFVVGDDDQLIYGWRHADPRGILDFHARMPPRPWSTTYALLTNYRCSRSVVETAARLIANNVVREPKDVRPRDGAQEGALRFAGAPSWPDRAAAMCTFLRAEKARLACDWRDLAVLCRYRSQQLLAALALDAEEIPRTPLLGHRLLTHPAARLLRAYLDLVQSPDTAAGSEIAFLLNRPNRYLSKAAVTTAGAASQPWAHLQTGAAEEPPAGPRPLSALVAQVERVAAGLRASPPTAERLIVTVLDAFALEDHWEAEAAASDAGGERDGAGPFQILDALLLLAELYPDPGAYLGAWDRLRADEETHTGTSEDTLAREESTGDRVVVGTIHAAKGREYHAVVIPDYDCDLSRSEPAELEEERRVVYVGVTRARDTALFTVDTSTMYVHPFLRELVETPEPDEHASLAAWLDDEDDASLRRRIDERIGEIEVLFPELVEAAPASGEAAPGGQAPAGG